MKEIETYCLFAVYLLSCCMTAFDVSDYFKGLATVPYPLFWANRVETHGRIFLISFIFKSKT